MQILPSSQTAEGSLCTTIVPQYPGRMGSDLLAGEGAEDEVSSAVLSLQQGALSLSHGAFSQCRVLLIYYITVTPLSQQSQLMHLGYMICMTPYLRRRL